MKHLNMSDTSKSSINITNKPVSSLQEAKQDRTSPMISDDTQGINKVTTSKPPTVGIEHEVRIISALRSPSPPAIDTPSITDQPTWMLPTVSERQIKPSQAQTEGGDSYVGLIRNLVKSSGIYAISSLASPLVSLLLLPFLTRVLSHTDYGALAVLETVIALFSSITTLGVDAVFAIIYAQDCKTSKEKRDALSTLTLLLFLIVAPIAIAGVIIAPWLSLLLLNSTSYSAAIGLSVLLVVLQNLTIPSLMWMRVENRAVFYSVVSLANCSIIAGSTVFLAGMLHMGIIGALVAMSLGNAIIVVGTLPLIFLRTGFRLRSTMAVSMLGLGIPYAMNYITMWLLQASDRYLLGHFVSLSAAANYTIAYSLGSGVGFVITQPFAMAWWVLIHPIARRDDAPHVFRCIFRWYSFFLLFTTLGLSLLGVSVLDLLFPVSYHGQSQIISVIALAIVFNSLFVVFNLGMTLQRKTWMAFIALLCSALFNLGANILLIPLYGSMGAAIATLVAYIVLALVSYLFNQMIYPIPFQVGLVLAALGIGIALYFVDNTFVQEQTHVIVWGIHIGVLSLYGSILAVLGILPWYRKNKLK